MSKCQRCKKETNITTMSIFNTDIICISCKSVEETHPDYNSAKEAELKEVKKGNFNFKGIGKPNNL